VCVGLFIDDAWKLLVTAQCTVSLLEKPGAASYAQQPQGPGEPGVGIQTSVPLNFSDVVVSLGCIFIVHSLAISFFKHTPLCPMPDVTERPIACPPTRRGHILVLQWPSRCMA